MLQKGNNDITPETKRKLVSLMEQQVTLSAETTSLSKAVLLTAQSLVQSFNEGVAKLVLPSSVIPQESSPE